MSEPATSAADRNERIKQLLKERGISERQASLRATGKPTLIKDIRNGKSRNPRGDSLQKLANVLKCSVDYLLVHEPLPPGAPQAGGTTEPPRTGITHGITCAEFAHRAATIASRASQWSANVLLMHDRASDTMPAE